VRIAYLVSQYPAPSHTFIRREVAALRSRGLVVDTCSIRAGESLSEVDRAEEATTFVVLARPAWRAALGLAGSLVATLARRPRRWLSTLRWTLRHRLPGPGGRLRALAYFAEATRLARALERRGATHLHSHFANPAAVVGLAAARWLGIGWSVTIHGHSDLHGPTAPLLPAKLAEARFVATVSRFGREQVLRLVGPEAAGKVHVVRCGIEPGLLPRPGRRPPGGGPLEILSVGRLSPEKGQAGLVEAFAAAVARGLGARLVLIGGGPEEGRLRAAVQARGLADRVELRGPQPEAAVFAAMAQADLFALSSLMEGLPVVLMEALALGLPVVAPALTGIPELVVDGESGLLYEVGDWAGLADRLLRLAGDPGLRARLAEAGRLRVLAEFDAALAVEPLIGLFQAAHAPLGRTPGPAVL
jgi:glycosyltransferase involved in cell wall biosynthesis